MLCVSCNYQVLVMSTSYDWMILITDFFIETDHKQQMLQHYSSFAFSVGLSSGFLSHVKLINIESTNIVNEAEDCRPRLSIFLRKS